MKLRRSFFVMMLVSLTFLQACSSGGSGGSGPAGSATPLPVASTITGTAAIGTPAGGVNVTIRDALGTVVTVTTENDGIFTADVSEMTPPCLLRMPHPATSGAYLYSYAGSAGTVNIHPLTDPIIRAWFKKQGFDIDADFASFGSAAIPVPAEIEIGTIKTAIRQVLMDLLKAVSPDLGTPPEAFDLLTTPFSADHTGFDQVLDGVTVAMSGSTLSIAVKPFTAMDSAMTASGGDTVVTLDTGNIAFTPDTTPPTAPAGLTGSAMSPKHLILSWLASTSTDVIGYHVYQEGSKIATVTSTVCSVAGLKEATSYTFFVKAFDAAGNISDASNTVTRTTRSAATDTKPPGTFLIKAYPMDSSRITLKWGEASDNVWTIGYIVYRDGLPIAKVITRPTYSDAGLAAGTLYTYTVKAFDAAMNLSSGCVASARTYPSIAGTRDMGFGSDGLVRTSFPNKSAEVGAVALQPDGKIVVAGYTYTTDSPANDEVAVVRYNADGTLDTGFGTAGRVTTAAGSGARANAMALAPDGKIIIAGTAYNGTGKDFLVIRYNADGSLDSGFGAGGKVITPVRYGDYDSSPGTTVGANAFSVVVQQDGKVILAGEAYHCSVGFCYPHAVALTRHNADGTPDAGFGAGGIVTAAYAYWYNTARALALQADGKILTAGGKSNGGRYQTVIARYNSDGQKDSGFGSEGVVLGPLGLINSLVLQPDGKIVAAMNPSLNDGAMVRYHPDGSVDASFGAAGQSMHGLQSPALTIQGDGKFVVAGTWDTDSFSTASVTTICSGQCPPNPTDLVLKRFHPDGQPDTSFGSGGTVLGLIGKDANAAAVALQKDGKIVVAGKSTHDSARVFTVMRFLP